MVRLGRMAEAALKSLEETGHYPKKVAWVSWPHGVRRDISHARLSVTEFRAFQAPDRADVPGFEGVRVRLSPIETDREGKRTADVLVRLPVLTDGKWEWRFCKIGKFKYTRSGGSVQPKYESGNRKWESRAIRMRKVPLADSRPIVASILTLNMVGLDPPDPRLAELSRAVRGWLCSEGVADRILSYLFEAGSRYARVNEVMTK